MKLFIFLVMFSQCCFASKLDMEYASFYSHLKKIDDIELTDLQFSFGFMAVGKNQLCVISHAEIITQKMTIPVNVDSFNRFTLPIEKALKLANAVVSIDLQENANQCDMSVQLETKEAFLKLEYSKADLVNINHQFSQFFENMGGIFSFLMPSAQGINMVFEHAPQVQNIDTANMVIGNELHLPVSWLAKASDGITLAQKPLRITALVQK